jgi:hypothetical protein
MARSDWLPTGNTQFLLRCEENDHDKKTSIKFYSKVLQYACETNNEGADRWIKSGVINGSVYMTNFYIKLTTSYYI